MLNGDIWRKAGAYRDESSHGEVIRQRRRNFLVLALELRTAGYHQFLSRITNGKSLDCGGDVKHEEKGKEHGEDHGLPVIGFVWPIRWTRWRCGIIVSKRDSMMSRTEWPQRNDYLDRLCLHICFPNRFAKYDPRRRNQVSTKGLQDRRAAERA